MLADPVTDDEWIWPDAPKAQQEEVLSAEEETEDAEMAKIESWFDCDLKKPVQVQVLNGNVFSLDNNGSRIGVKFYDNGQKTTVTGSVSGRFILANGQTIDAITGTLATVNGQSVAYLDVPQSVLHVPGPLKITIQLTDSSVVTTVAAILATVYQTKTDDEIVPSQQVIDDWNAAITQAIGTQNAAIAAQNTQISDLKSALSDSISGEMVVYKTNEYKNHYCHIVNGQNYIINVVGYYGGNYGANIIFHNGDHTSEDRQLFTVYSVGVIAFTADDDYNFIRTANVDVVVYPVSNGQLANYLLTNGQILYGRYSGDGTNYTNISYPLASGKTYVVKIVGMNPNDAAISGIKQDDTRVQLALASKGNSLHIIKPTENYKGIRSIFTTLEIQEINEYYAQNGVNDTINAFGIKPICEFESSSSYMTQTIYMEANKAYTIIVKKLTSTQGIINFRDSNGNTVLLFTADKTGLYRIVPTQNVADARTANLDATVFDGDYLQEIRQETAQTTVTITVESDGTGDYSTIQAALDAILDNSQNKQYIIEVGAGTFDISSTELPFITMKNYVTINGKGKGKTIVVNRKSSTVYNQAYAVFDPGHSDGIEYACLSNMTLISQGCKCPVHIDANYDRFKEGGKIILDSLKLIDENTVGMQGASFDNGFGMITAGGVNCGLRAGQSVIVKNCESNGAIYAHNSANQSGDGAYFEVTDCICDYTSVSDLLSGTNDIAVIQGSKIKNLRFASHGTGQGGTDNSKYWWNVTLIGNEIDRVVATMVDNNTNPYAMFDTYFNGTFAITSSDIHSFCYNASETDIDRGDFVEISKYVGNTHLGTLVKGYDSGRVYGLAMEDIDSGEVGVIQTAGVIQYQVGESVSIGDGLVYNGTNLVKTNAFPEFIALENGTSGNSIFVRFVNMLQ